MRRSEAYRFRANIETAAQTVDDKTALTMIQLYPKWESGKEYSEGFKLRYADKLYKVTTAHTSQDAWTPDAATTLFTRIEEEADGSLENPIPYDGNMALVSGLYYVQDGVKYICTRDTVNPVYNALAELVGLYVEVI